MDNATNDLQEEHASGARGMRPGGNLNPTHLACGTIAYAGLLIGFWIAAKHNPIGSTQHFPATFICFALLLAGLWYPGFGLAHEFAERVQTPKTRALLSALIAVPYLFSSVPTGAFQWKYFLILAAIPVGLSALLGFRQLPNRMTWQDAVALAVLAVTLMTHSLSGAWPAHGLGSFPKLYLTDVALYLFLVIRPVEGIGCNFVPTKSAVAFGVREWLYFAPIGIGLGLLLHFIVFYPRVHSPIQGFATFVGIFLLVATPEELLFRGVLQNLLEPLIGRTRALGLASVLFGLSHFPKGAAFNWGYVILASIAGIFYGRAWRSRRQVLASSLTHAGVDTVWTLWFR